MKISATEYAHIGNMYVLRQGLSLTHPESYPSLWVKKYGTIVGFPWKNLYGEEAQKAEEAYFIAKEAELKEIPKCPHCGELLY